ncbi:MAG TPA: hypothetical protein VLT16_01210 [Candidatus Limnocylindrales bacterium]|nr:hypothetical protein [Candidatus Limnocylindrales bacterium]
MKNTFVRFAVLVFLVTLTCSTAVMVSGPEPTPVWPPQFASGTK